MRHDGDSSDTQEVLAAKYDSGSTSLFAVSTHGLLWCWDLTTGVPRRRPVRLWPKMRRLTIECRPMFSPAGMRFGLLTVPADSDPPYAEPSPYPSRSMAVFDLSNPAGPIPPPIQLRGHGGRILAFSFFPDGRYIATASEDATVRLWRTEDGSCVETFTEHDAAVTHVVFSGNGNVLASAAEDGSVRVRKDMRTLLSRYADSARANGYER